MPILDHTIEKRFFTITEVASEIGENASVLRYWEKEFRQLNPRTNARGKRFYTKKEIEVIHRIHDLVRTQGFTIDGARKVLNGETVGPEPDQKMQVIARLQQLKSRLLESVQGKTQNAG